jgi:hypothetical protein
MAPPLARLGVLVLLALGAAPLTARAQEEPVVTPSAEPPPGGTPADGASPAPASPAPVPAPPPAAPSPPPPAPSPRNYPPPAAFAAPAGPIHRGFYLRMHLGLGFTSLTGSGSSVPTTVLHGPGAGVGIALGGGVAPDLAIYGNLFASIANDPEVTTGGIDGGKSPGSVALRGFGCGVAYYLEPLNIYLSGALALMTMQREDGQGNVTDQSDTGFGLDAMVGKEWWVSPHWGLGAALQAVVAGKMKDQNDSRVGWSGEGFNLLFSATFY